MFDNNKLQLLYNIYKKKNFLTLEDIGRVFGNMDRTYCLNLLKKLMDENYLEKIPETQCPIKFDVKYDVKSNPLEIDTIEVSPNC